MNSKIVFDTDCLSSFLCTGSEDILLKLYKDKIFIYISHRTSNEKYFDRLININNKERKINEVFK